MAGRVLTASPGTTTMRRAEWIPVLIRMFAERALGDGGWIDDEDEDPFAVGTRDVETPMA